MSRLLAFTALSLSFAATLPPTGAWQSVADPLPPVTHYVDQANGSETADGLTPATAWKYAPGDPRSTHTTGYWTTAGRHCRVLGVYEGDRIWLTNAGGTAGQPCCLTGGDFGGPMATMHGGSPVSLRAPVSQADAGGHPDWNNGVLKIAEWAPAPGVMDGLYDDGGILVPSRYPKALNRYLSDDTEASASMYFDNINGATIDSDNQIVSAAVAAVASVGCRCYFWVTGNEMASGIVSDITGSVVTLTDKSAGTAYASTRVYLEETVPSLSEGERALLEPGKALVWPLHGVVRRSVPPSEGARGIRVHAVSTHVKIRGFRFTGFYGHPERPNSIGYRIWPIFMSGSGAGNPMPDHIAIEHNVFTDNFCKAMDTSSATNILLRENIIQRGYRAGGVQIDCQRNIFRDLGDTGIRMTGTNNQVVRHNILTRVGGVHANGIAVYESGTGHLIEENAVIYTDRCIVNQGDPRENYGRSFVRNVLRHRVPSNTIINSRMGFRQNTSAAMGGIRYVGNIATGSVYGLGVNTANINNELIDNATTAILYQSSSPDMRSTWTQTGNVTVPPDYLYDARHTMTSNHVIAYYPEGGGITTPNGRTYIEIDLRYLDEAMAA